jgi:nucleotide-binding universal stress UspA family protein
MPITHIVSPVDFSAASRRSFETSMELASAFGAKLDVVHSVEVLTYRGVEYREVMSTKSYADEREKTRQELEEWADIARAKGIETNCRVLEGDSRRTIIDYAVQNEADLIVIGAKGHSRLHDLFIGSVANQVSAHAPCSVHLVR